MSPCLDGQFLVGTGVEILEPGKQKNIPYMAGSTSQDIMPPIIYKMGKDWCAAQARQGKQPSYAWFFDRQLPGDKCGASMLKLWYTMFINKAVGE